MSERPKQLSVLSLILLGIAISFPVQIMLLYGHLPWEIAAIGGKLTHLNWLVLIAALGSSYLAFRASPFAMLTLPVLTGLLAYNNWLVGEVGTDYSQVATMIATLGFLGALKICLSEKAFGLFLHPSRRWWLTPTRYRIEIPIRVKLMTGPKTTEVYAKTYDISSTGLFIPSVLTQVNVGTSCYVSFPLPGLELLQCRAEVVRKTEPSGKYPAGMGMRFLGLSYYERRKLEGALCQAGENSEAFA